MLFSFLNPPKGKVLRKRSPNIQNGAPPSRHPTKKSKPESLAPEITVSAVPVPAPVPARANSTSAHPQVTRSHSHSLRKPPRSLSHISHPAATDPTPSFKISDYSHEGGPQPARRKSVIKTILERRRERIKAANLAYDEWGKGARGWEYDPKLGVENLPLAGWSGSGLHIGSPIARIGREGEGLVVDGGNEGAEIAELDGSGREGKADAEVEAVAVGGEEREYVGRKNGVRRLGGYWGDFEVARGSGQGLGSDVGGGGDGGGSGEGGGAGQNKG